jgi:hypothetical protein
MNHIINYLLINSRGVTDPYFSLRVFWLDHGLILDSLTYLNIIGSWEDFPREESPLPLFLHAR